MSRTVINDSSDTELFTATNPGQVHDTALQTALTGVGGSTLADVITALQALGETQSLADVITQLTTMAGGSTLAAIVAGLVALGGAKTLADVVTALGTLLTNTQLRASAVDVDIRQNSTQTANMPTGTALSAEIDKRGYAGGLIHMPAAWTAASVGFYVSPTTGGTFQPLYDYYNSLAQIASPAQGKSYDLPPQLFAVRYFKIWSQNGSGVDTNQTRDGGTDFVVDLGA